MSQPAQDPAPTPPEAIRFLIGKATSDMLAAAGEFYLIEAQRSPMPEHGGRFIAYALPITKQAADDAARVAKGTHRAVKRSTGSPSTSSTFSPLTP